MSPIIRALAIADFSYRTVQFVGISAFHTRVSDPLIGGTYMTVWDPLNSSLVHQ